MAAAGDEVVLPLSVPLPGGRELVVRATEPDDVDGLVTLYAGLGDSDRHRRFFTQFRATRAWVVEWTRRCRDGFSMVAVDDASGAIVGEAAYVLQPNGDGDFAITVDREWRGWLGPFLLDLLVGVAAERGVPNLEADILTENRSMQAIVRRRDAVIGGDSDYSVAHVVIGTTGRQATWPPRARGPKVLVEAPGGRWGAAAIARAGFEVLGCPGPDRRRRPCPALAGAPCPLAAGADAVVVALPPERSDDLVAAHAALHPDVPVIVVDVPGRIEDGPGDTPGAAPARPVAASDTPGDASGHVCRLEAGATSAELLHELRRRFGQSAEGGHPAR